MKRVKAFISDSPAYAVPLHIRNAPTKLMKDLNYGAGYKYPPHYCEPIDQRYLPEEMKSVIFFNLNKVDNKENSEPK